MILSSTFHASKAALPHMLDQGWGRIVNTGAPPDRPGSWGRMLPACCLNAACLLPLLPLRYAVLRCGAVQSLCMLWWLAHLARHSQPVAPDPGSMHALVASPYKSAYNAAKHGVAGFTKTLALEVRQGRKGAATALVASDGTGRGGLARLPAWSFVEGRSAAPEHPSPASCRRTLPFRSGSSLFCSIFPLRWPPRASPATRCAPGTS